MDEGLAFPCKNAFLRELPADSSQYEDAAMPKRILAAVFRACPDDKTGAPPSHMRGIWRRARKKIRKRAALRGGFCYVCRKCPIYKIRY